VQPSILNLIRKKTGFSFYLNKITGLFMKKYLSFLVENYKALIASFLVAIVLWAAVTTNRIYTERIDVPLNIVRLAPNRVLTNLPPTRAVLEVSGQGRSLIALNFIKPHINLELPEIEYSTIINLDHYKSQFKIGREIGVEIVEIIEPKDIELTVDQFVSEKKPVKLRGSVKPMAGYILSGIEREADSVLVEGPRGLIRKMKWVESDSYQFNNARYPFESEIHISSPHPDIVKVNPEKLWLKFQIEQLVERTLYNIPIRIIEMKPDLTATAGPATITIRVKGGESIVSSLSAEDISAVFNFAKHYKQGSLYYTPEIITPKGVTVLETSPKSFVIRLKRKVN